MLITLLDRASLGEDTPLGYLSEIGEVEIYDATKADEVCSRVACSEILIINKVKITKEVFEAAKKLKLICVFATGYDNIDLDEARAKNVAVCNVPGYSSPSVALQTVAMVTSLMTHLNEYRSYVKSGAYTSSGVPNCLVPVYHELAGKTWGIIGYGGIGKAVARVANAFDANVIVNKRNPVNDIRCVDLDTLASESDIITIHCPLTDLTRGMINARLIDLMKPSVILINEARGAVLNENDVADAVLSGKISGFGCDVYGVEPFTSDHPYNKIKDLDNVILTPHCAWGAYESRERCMNIIIDNIKSFLNSETLNRVDILKQK